MKRKNESQPLRYKIVLIFLASFFGCSAIVISIVGVSFAWFFDGLDDTGFWSELSGCLEWWGDPNDPETIAYGANIKFPDSTSNIEASSDAWRDCNVNVRFEIAPSDLDTFLQSTYIDELQVRLGSYVHININYDVDWQFEPNKEYLYGTGTSEDGYSEYQTIVVDTQNSSIYIVYVSTLLQ